MISSFELSERYNAQTILWDACGVIVAIIRKTSAIVGRIFAMLSHFGPILYAILTLCWPDVVAIARGVAVVATWGALIALGLGVLVWLLANPVVIVGAGIIAVYAWLTAPRCRGSLNSKGVK